MITPPTIAPALVFWGALALGVGPLMALLIHGAVEALVEWVRRRNP